MRAQAEALVRFSGAVEKAALEAAREAARTPISFEALPGGIRIVAVSEEGRMAALTAAGLAALALIAALKDDNAFIEGVRPLAAAPQHGFQSRGSLSKQPIRSQGRVRPEVLMGEVAAPRVTPEKSREAFRHFMTSHRLRPTIWAKEAGVSSGEILGFLTGRSRGLSDGVAEKLARAAKVRVEEMFE